VLPVLHYSNDIYGLPFKFILPLTTYDYVLTLSWPEVTSAELASILPTQPSAWVDSSHSSVVEVLVHVVTKIVAGFIVLRCCCC